MYDGELTAASINALHSNVNVSRVLLFVCLFAAEDAELRHDHFVFVQSGALSTSARGDPVLTSRGAVLTVRCQISAASADFRYRYSANIAVREH